VDGAYKTAVGIASKGYHRNIIFCGLFISSSIIVQLLFVAAKVNIKMITWQDFEKIDIRGRTSLPQDDFPNRKKTSYQLSIDFGEVGIKKFPPPNTTLLQHKAELWGKR